MEKSSGLPIRISFAGLWTCCDREGRFKWKPRQLKSDIIPHDEVDFSRVLDALFAHGFIKKYRVDSTDYGFIPTWHTHQVINNRESKSILPDPKETFFLQPVDASSTREPRNDNASPTESRDGQGERKGKEGKEKPSARKARGAEVNNSQTAKAQCQTRHSRYQEAIQNWYREWAGTDCPWNGAEGRQLSELLKAWPGVADAEFFNCLSNLAKSDCISSGTRPSEWLHKLPKFVRTPLDQYWKPKVIEKPKPSKPVSNADADEEMKRQLGQ